MDQQVSLWFSTEDETAVAGSDYVASNGLVEFETDVTDQVIRIPILNDGVLEDFETFRVRLTNGDTQVVVGTKSIARVGIWDNDSGFSFGTGYMSVNESDGVARVWVSLRNYGGKDLVIHPRLVEGLLTNQQAVCSFRMSVRIVKSSGLGPPTFPFMRS